MPLCKDIIKRRVLHFKTEDPETTRRAKELLAAVQGVSKARQIKDNQLSIHYDVRELSLQMIEQALSDVGFDLADSIMCKVKRGLIAYCEDALRESLGVVADDAEPRDLTFHESEHADPRPYHWRNYS